MKFGTVSVVMCHATEAAGIARAVFILSFYFEALQTIFGIVFIVSEGNFRFFFFYKKYYKRISLWSSRLKEKETEKSEIGNISTGYLSLVNSREIKNKKQLTFLLILSVYIFHV